MVPVGTTPFVTFTGVTVKELPLQIVAFIFVTAGIGFTATVTVNGTPVQVPKVGVTV